MLKKYLFWIRSIVLCSIIFDYSKYRFSAQIKFSASHNLKCFANWTVTELRVLAILSRIYYFAIFDDKSWLFFTENPLFGHNFWKKKPRTCNLSTVQNQLLRVPMLIFWPKMLLFRTQTTYYAKSKYSLQRSVMYTCIKVRIFHSALLCGDYTFFLQNFPVLWGNPKHFEKMILGQNLEISSGLNLDI